MGVSGKFLCLTLALAIFTDSAKSADNPIVSTQLGQVEGVNAITVGDGVAYQAFRGIPYAEAPVGNLRFEPPIPKKSWIGTWDATKDGSPCIQGGDPLVGSEDCLVINVYTPTVRSGSLPVLVMVHGGAFIGGSADYANLGPDYLLDKGIIVVTFNYRLGVLGFGSTGDTVLPGNNGLRDQSVALGWVKNNIANFGGDPTAVTLAGQSAGSASVAYHLQSPLSQGLFRSAILESGTSLNPWAFGRDVASIVNLIAVGTGVDTSSSAKIKAGLKTVDVGTLQTVASDVSSQYILDNNPKDGLAFAPVEEPEHDGAFFTGRSHQRLVDGNFTKVPTLIGYNTLEGSYEIGTIMRVYLLQYDLTPSKLVPASMDVSYIIKILLGNKIKNYYFNGRSVAFSQLRLLQFLSDDQFARGIIEFASQISKRTTTYLYRFSYEGALWGLSNRTIPGVTHSEELGYLWRTPYDPQTTLDTLLRQRMTTMWTDFIKTGNPTPSAKEVNQNVIWGPTDGQQRTFADIGANLVIGTKPGGKDIAFWDDLFGRYAVPPLSTY